MPFLPRNGLLQYVADAAPKLLLLEAPAGYGKSTVARQIAGDAAVVDALGADAVEFHRRLFEGLMAGASSDDAAERKREALGATSVAAWRGLCIRVWEDPCDHGTLIFENTEDIVEHPEIVATLSELFARPHPTRRVIVCTRRALPVRIGRFAYPHEVLRLGIADLRFSAGELASLFDLSTDDPQLASIVEVTRGWPIAALLLRRLRRRQPMVSALHGQDGVALFRLLADEVLSLLSPEAREALHVVVALPDATFADVTAALGDSGRDAVRALLSEAPFIDAYGDALQPHPLLRELIRESSSPALREAGERAARGHLARGERLRAAKIFIELGDQMQAIGAVRGLEASTWIGTPSYELGTILAALDRHTLMTDPGIWAYASTLSRALTISPMEWLHEGLEVWNRHHRTMSDDVARSVIANIVNASMNAGMLDECERWLAEMRARAAGSLVYLLWSTAIDAMRGRPLDVEQLEREIVEPLGPGYPQSIYLYDVIARIHRLRGDREAERAASARALDVALGTGLPLAIALTSTDAAFGAWLAGEDGLYREYMAIAHQHYDASPNEKASHFIECADGRGITARHGNEKLKTRAYGYLLAAGRAGAERRELLARALDAADLSSQPYARIIVRVALAAAQPERASRLLAEAAAFAADVDSPRLRAAIADLRRGTDHPMLAPLVRRFRARADEIVFDIISGRLVIDGDVVTLGERQLELLTLLALRRRAVHRSEIASTIWPDASAESALGALRTTISRLRAMPGLRDIVITASDGYALATNVGVPLRRLRSLLDEAETAAALAPGDREELEAAFDALVARDQTRVARWEWFAQTERELDVLQFRAGYALMQDALQRDPQRALDLARAMLAYDELDVTARTVAVRALLALGEVAAARRDVDAFEQTCREAGTPGAEMPLRALLSATGA
jgi:DNA-binding SARP family transcriptional activator